MNKCESIIIMDSAIEEKKRFETIDRICGEIGKCHIEDIGIRKLAFNIKNRDKGHYVKFTFEGDVDLIKKIEKYYNNDDTILRFLIIKL